ncbi:hypothetical protein ACTJKO_12950 [Curtobacterium sp. 22159]|uniref:hypothetical protein n=1 Tax=Curtobacterium sp. 22159 TaxID=3453882 RepID=UPI003F848A33
MGAFVASALLILTACSDTGPHAPASKNSSMTPEQSHENVMSIFRAVKSVVGEEGWEAGTQSSWLGCSSNGEDGAQFTLTAIRKHPLPAAADDVTRRVAKALKTDVGLDGVPVQHDDTLRPPRTVVSYPNGYNGGTAADGFGVEFQSGTDLASLLVWGHCVPGNVPKLGTPLNPRPTDLP